MTVLGPPAGRDTAPPLHAELRRALRAEHRRCAAWVAAAIVTTGIALAAGLGEIGIVVGVLGMCLAGWSARLAAGIRLTLRDLGTREHPPRRAVVMLLHDPNPRAVRPLLAVWPDAPSHGARLPKPESVWRCDDELLALESSQGDSVLHEAWVDTGRHGWSTMRWVYADAGLAVPHRRAILGRLYVHLVLRGDRPGPPAPLAAPEQQTFPDTGGELPLGGGFGRSVAPRVMALGALAVITWLLA